MAIAPEGRTVTILGSTGSIGKNTVRLIQEAKETYAVQALVAKGNVDMLAAQAIALKARRAVVADTVYYEGLKSALAGTGIEVAAGADAVEEAAMLPAEWIMAAIVGAAGLKPTLRAIEQGKVVALANKECLVCAGELMLRYVKEYGATLIPVDSEHNAIFQVFDHKHPSHVRKIILTASGGPFRNYSYQQMAEVTPEQAVKHPNWQMGTKISVDSATMVNKGLELMEASYLFGLCPEQIEILVHPESIIHSMVEYVDGSMLAQLGAPDMCVPIAYTLAWPERMVTSRPGVRLADIGKLHFEPVNTERFPAVKLAYEVLTHGGASPLVYNAANEIAVEHFLKGRVGFTEIVDIIRATLDAFSCSPPETIEEVYRADREARRIAYGFIPQALPAGRRNSVVTQEQV